RGGSRRRRSGPVGQSRLSSRSSAARHGPRRRDRWRISAGLAAGTRHRWCVRRAVAENRVSLRSRARRSLPYAIAIIGGFLLAYLIVAFLVFPSGVIPRDIRVPNVTGLPFDEAVRRLAERGLRGVKGEERFHAASPKGTVLEQNPAA